MVEGFSISDDLALSIDGSPGIFGPVDVIIPAAAFVIVNGNAEATVPFSDGEVHVSFPETGTGSFQINVDASRLNDCTTGVMEATLMLSLGAGENSLTLTRETDSKFRGDDSDGDGFSDAEELAAGSNPDDATSVPLGGEPGPALPQGATPVPALPLWAFALLAAALAGVGIALRRRSESPRSFPR